MYNVLVDISRLTADSDTSGSDTEHLAPDSLSLVTSECRYMRKLLRRIVIQLAGQIALGVVIHHIYVLYIIV